MLQVEIIGNVGSDAILKEISGKVCLTFSIAHTDRYTNKDGAIVEKTMWVSCIRTGGENLAPHIKKGSKLFIRGNYSDKLFQNGNGQSEISRSVNVSELQFLTPKQEQEPAQTATTQTTPSSFPMNDAVDPNTGLPF